jgi:SAM-dependent methyltransferase
MKDWKIYERVDPSNKSTYYLYRIHLDRYLAYASLARNLVVLDVGCAYGFGSGALGKEAIQVMGIDTSPEIVREAKTRYGGRNIDFAVMSAEHLGFREHSIDGAYAFEVVEHLSKPDLFFEDLEEILTRTGFAILSTPNKLITTDENPFHVTEYSWEEFNNSLSKYFSSVQVSGMSHVPLFESLIRVRRFLPSNIVELLKGNRLFEFLIDRIARQGKKREGESSSGLLAVCNNTGIGIEEKAASAELLESEQRLMVSEGQDH